MINLPNRVALMQVILECGYAPWAGNVQWRPIADRLNITTDGARNQYRRMVEALDQMGYTVEQFALQCQDEVAITTDLPSGRVTMSQADHRSLQEAYSNADGHTIGGARLANAYHLHPKTMAEYVDHYGWQRNDGKGLVAQRATAQAQLVRDAEKWRTLQRTVLDYIVPPKVAILPICPPVKNGDMLVLTVFSDLHYGKVGYDYNLQIAKQRLATATQYLLSQTDPANISRVIVPIGGDAMNVDNMRATTTAGTPQSNVRVLEMLNTYPSLMLSVIDTIRTHFLGATIELVANSGNHDEMAVIMLGQIAAAAYRDTPGVKVHDGHGRVYVEHGKTLICFTHGDRIADNKIGGIMAGERSQSWGRCPFRYVIRGHYHTFTMAEHHGVLVVGVPALSGIDDWHDQQGYVTSKPGALALTFNEKVGLSNITTYWA